MFGRKSTQQTAPDLYDLLRILQSNAEKLELSINVWAKNDVANCF